MVATRKRYGQTPEIGTDSVRIHFTFLRGRDLDRTSIAARVRTASNNDCQMRGRGGIPSDLVAASEAGYLFAGAESQRLDGHGGLAAARGHQAAAIADEQVRYVVRAMELVDHRDLHA